jgi:hypothetical protein
MLKNILQNKGAQAFVTTAEGNYRVGGVISLK